MILNLITGTTALDNSTTGVSLAAVTSPVWLPWLHAASDGAALIMPLLGATWLVVQIVSKVRDIIKSKKDK